MTVFLTAISTSSEPLRKHLDSRKTNEWEEWQTFFWPLPITPQTPNTGVFTWSMIWVRGEGCEQEPEGNREWRGNKPSQEDMERGETPRQLNSENNYLFIQPLFCKPLLYTSTGVSHGFTACMALLFRSYFIWYSWRLFRENYNFPVLQMKRLGAKRWSVLLKLSRQSNSRVGFK